MSLIFQFFDGFYEFMKKNNRISKKLDVVTLSDRLNICMKASSTSLYRYTADCNIVDIKGKYIVPQTSKIEPHKAKKIHIKYDVFKSLAFNHRYDENRKLKDIQCEISNIRRIYYLYMLLKKGIKSQIFIPSIFCFRGRMYYRSSVFVTECKESRYIYYYGVYNLESVIPTNTFITKYVDEVEDEIKNIKTLFNINIEGLFVNQAIFFILVSVGREFIDKKKVYMSSRDLIKVGYHHIIDSKSLTSLEDVMFINHQISLLNELKGSTIRKKVQSKDATASFMQNLIRLLG